MGSLRDSREDQASRVLNALGSLALAQEHGDSANELTDRERLARQELAAFKRTLGSESASTWSR